MKIKPIGICDHCEQPIKIDWYTSHHQPRRYCCRTCLNTANSRIGAPIRSVKAIERIAAGTWFNPASVLTPEQRLETAKLGGAAAGAKFRKEVAAGEWRNPALSETAREKLSRPRKTFEPILHRAHEKLNQGAKMLELTPEEAEAYREYRRELKRNKSK